MDDHFHLFLPCIIIIVDMNPSCSHNTVAGQELCYFCHQRNKRNVYIDISDEKKARELQYEKILQDYQDKKRLLASARDREVKKVSGLFAKDASSHNFSRGQSKVSIKNCHDIIIILLSIILAESSKRQWYISCEYMLLKE